MKFQKLLFPLLSVITLTAAVAFSIFLLNAEDKAPTASEITKQSLLFVYEGENAKLEPAGNSGTEFTLSVPIASKESKLTWFTDRPNRDAGHMSYENFVKLFYSNTNDSFKVDPPNVAIQIGSTTLIAEMTEPKIITGTNNAESIIANFTLVSGTAKEEMGGQKSFIAAHVSRSDDVKSIGAARTLESVSVFVDDVETMKLSNVTSEPISNASEVTQPVGTKYSCGDGTDCLGESLTLVGDFEFRLPYGYVIFTNPQTGCQVMMNGKRDGYETLPYLMGEMTNEFSEVVVYYGLADPYSYSPPPSSYSDFTWTLFCTELEVTQSNWH